MLHLARATFLFKLASQMIVEAIKAVSKLGALLAAYGWYTEQAIWMERGGATVAYSFLAGLVFLVIFGAIWGVATLMLMRARRKDARSKDAGQRPDTGSPTRGFDLLSFFRSKANNGPDKDRPDTGSHG